MVVSSFRALCLPPPPLVGTFARLARLEPRAGRALARAARSQLLFFFSQSFHDRRPPRGARPLAARRPRPPHRLSRPLDVAARVPRHVRGSVSPPRRGGWVSGGWGLGGTPRSLAAVPGGCGAARPAMAPNPRPRPRPPFFSLQAAADAGEPTLFDKIVAKQIPAAVLYEDESCLAFKDVGPQAPVHFLVIPKQRDGLSRLAAAETRHEALLGHLMVVASRVAKEQGLGDGFRVVVNDGPDGSQSVYHLHLHVLGGRQMTWPPG